MTQIRITNDTFQVTRMPEVLPCANMKNRQCQTFGSLMHRILFVAFLLSGLSLKADDAQRFTKLPESMHQELPEGVSLLTADGKDNGVRFIDLNGDGHLDIVFSNAQSYGVYLFNPEEKKGLQWFLGWNYVLREGKAGDANALPIITNGMVSFDAKAKVMNTGFKPIAFSELLRMPARHRSRPKNR